MALLEIDGLSTHYHTPRGLLRAVDGVTLSLEAGETLGLVGESGCGKSTLGKAVLGLAPTTGGEVRFAGQVLTGLGHRAMVPFRRRLQMVFQDPFGSFNPRQTIGEILEAPLAVHRLGSRQERRAAVLGMLERVGLGAEATGRYPHEFSGGQRQRIGIARALILKPAIILCDEPVSALDVSIQAQILNLLVTLKQELGLSYLFISHDLSIVRYFADRIAVMYLGRIVESAEAGAIWTRPAHPYTQALIAAVPDPTRKRHAAPLAGDLPSPEDVPAGCRFHPRCPRASALCRTSEPALRMLASGHEVACHHA